MVVVERYKLGRRPGYEVRSNRVVRSNVFILTSVIKRHYYSNTSHSFAKFQVDRKQKGAYNPPPLASLQEGSHGEQPGESQTEREKKAKLLSRVGSWEYQPTGGYIVACG